MSWLSAGILIGIIVFFKSEPLVSLFEKYYQCHYGGCKCDVHYKVEKPDVDRHLLKAKADGKKCGKIVHIVYGRGHFQAFAVPCKQTEAYAGIQYRYQTDCVVFM